MEVSQDSQNSIVFESSSQDPSNSGIVFMADDDSKGGTGSQAEGKQRGAHGMMLTSCFIPKDVSFSVDSYPAGIIRIPSLFSRFVPMVTNYVFLVSVFSLVTIDVCSHSRVRYFVESPRF